MKNLVLLLASLLFYGWGKPKYLVFMLATVTQSYIAALLIERFRGTKIAKLALAVSAVAGLGLLAYCKYADFFIGNFNAVTGLSVPLLQGGSAGRHQLLYISDSELCHRCLSRRRAGTAQLY